MKKCTIGIDPGFEGGIAVVRAGKVKRALVMPTIGSGKSRHYDLVQIREIFLRYATKYELTVAIEKQHVFPKNGAVSSFKLGYGYGQLIGVCMALQIPMIVVTPTTWMKTILVGYPKRSKKDKPSISFVQQRFPKTKLTKSDKAKKPHDGITDAICIALYGATHEA